MNQRKNLCLTQLFRLVGLDLQINDHVLMLSLQYFPIGSNHFYYKNFTIIYSIWTGFEFGRVQ